MIHCASRMVRAAQICVYCILSQNLTAINLTLTLIDPYSVFGRNAKEKSSVLLKNYHLGLLHGLCNVY